MIQLLIFFGIIMKVLLLMMDLFDLPQYVFNNYVHKYFGDTFEQRLILFVSIFSILVLTFIYFT